MAVCVCVCVYVCVSTCITAVSSPIRKCVYEREGQVQRTYNNSLFSPKSIRNLLNTQELERLTLLSITVRPVEILPNYHFKYVTYVLRVHVIPKQVAFHLKPSRFCSERFQFFDYALNYVKLVVSCARKLFSFITSVSIFLCVSHTHTHTHTETTSLLIWS